MKGVFRKILLPLPSLVRWYLSRKRVYRFRDLTIEVFPGVFHPGIFYSTTFLLQFVEKQVLRNSTVLEVGAGSGIISLMATRMGASVTATDISNKAIQNIHQNAKANKVTLSVVQSDLFERLPPQKFDWIFINPPYYPRQPIKEEEFAWFCGEHHEYFMNFFEGLAPFISSHTQTIMVLSEVCDLGRILEIAVSHGFELIKILEKKVLMDGKNYLFQIKPIVLNQGGASTHTVGK